MPSVCEPGKAGYIRARISKTLQTHTNIGRPGQKRVQRGEVTVWMIFIWEHVGIRFLS